MRATDVAKRVIDLGFHPSTVYFPLVVEEALMVEPTETESRETLERFADALTQAAGEASTEPDLLHEAPVTTPVRRLDEARAARDLRLRWAPVRIRRASRVRGEPRPATRDPASGTPGRPRPAVRRESP